MTVRPLYDNVLIKRLEAQTTTPSGIIIPATATEKRLEGVIQAVGAGRISDNGDIRPLQVKNGDRVLFKKYSGESIKIDGEDLLIVKESDIIAIIEV